MSASSSLADCCPKCDPFDATAVPPADVTDELEHPGSLRATYECTQGHRWTCWWDARSAGWPVSRTKAA